jgi:hypothetical protein
MPDFASRRLASTSWALFPMEDTMPMPVTTTRLMDQFSCACVFARWTPDKGFLCIRRAGRYAGAAAIRSAAFACVDEQPDPQILGLDR